jgi:hypothetical protein
MAGWVWGGAAVLLGVVIFLLLRTRGGRGRHRVPAVEYVPPPEEQPSDVEPDEPVEVREPDEPVDHLEVRGDVEEVDSAPEWAHGAAGEEEQAELDEDAELRHDEGYVETFGNDRTDAPDETDDPAEVPESGYGMGSSVSRRGVSGPEGWTVKGNADSLLFYTEDAPGYARAAADVWFENEEAATTAGFTRWDAHHR